MVCYVLFRGVCFGFVKVYVVTVVFAWFSN